MQVKQTIILQAILLSFLAACSQNYNSPALFEHPGYEFPYQLAEPDQSWKMPYILVEISGLGFVDDHRLACVQDEKGVIFIFNLKNGQVEKEIIFGDDGDYEGIEIIEHDAWVLKSNGTLYEVMDYLGNSGPDANKYKTALSGKNDTEGLAYDPVNNNLLIACKESPFLDGKPGKGHRAIYSYNLETKLLNAEPFLMISLDTIRYYKGDAIFKPSGLAIHPISGDIFILGSVGKLLLVFSGGGEMLAMINLNPKLFRQPEGICFSPDGTLYIASEGAGLHGTIMKFAKRP
jgi:uncharacterized protein YjiK